MSVGLLRRVVRTSRLRRAKRPATSLLLNTNSSSWTRLIQTGCRTSETCLSWATRETRWLRRPYACAPHKESGTQMYGWCSSMAASEVGVSPKDRQPEVAIRVRLIFLLIIVISDRSFGRSDAQVKIIIGPSDR